MEKSIDATAVRLESVACANCQSDKTRHVLTGHDRLNGLPGKFSIVQCTSCGLMYVNPRPTPDTIGLFYPDDYAPYVGTQNKTASKNKVSPVHYKETLASRFRWRWDLLKKSLLKQGETEIPEFVKPGKVLEIGCASGSFLAQLRAKGWDCYGIDLGESPIRHAKEQLQLNVQVSTVEDMEFSNDSFDMVVGWMVVEHLHDPLVGLKKVANVLKPDGYFVFSIPNAGSWELKLFKDKWYALHLPCHLYHYDIKSIKCMLNKAGFSVETVIYQKNVNNIIGSLWHLFNDLTGESRLTTLFKKWSRSNPDWLLLLLLPFSRTMCFFKQAGRITIWAKKTSVNQYDANDSRTCIVEN